MCVCVCVCVSSAVLVKKAKEKQPLTRKERRELKKKKRKNYDLISQTLQLWEKLRRLGNLESSSILSFYLHFLSHRHDLKAAERSDLLDQMMSLITGHVYEVIITSLIKSPHRLHFPPGWQ